MEPSYGKRLHKAARKDFKNFWSVHRWWTVLVSIMSAGVGVLIQVAILGTSSVLNLELTVTTAAGALVVSLIGNYIIAMRRGAEALDAERVGEIRSKDTKILDREKEIRALAKPPRTGAEQHYYEIAKLALAKHGPEAMKILYHMRTHDGIEFTDWVLPHLPSGLDRKAAERVLELLRQENIVNVNHSPDRGGTKSIWKIAGGSAMLAALDDLLYP
jgi:hypothetical protein